MPAAGYYRYWEKVFFEAVCTMLVSAIRSLHGTLRDVADSGCAAQPVPCSAVPLFRVRTLGAAPNVAHEMRRPARDNAITLVARVGGEPQCAACR